MANSIFINFAGANFVVPGQVTGDLFYAASSTTIARLADVATGNVLLSGGVGAAPSWGKVSLTAAISGVLPVANGGTNLASYAIGDLIYASGTTTLSKLADVAAGSVLVSGGVGAAPAWSATPTVSRVLVGAGTSAAPSLTFSGDTDKGIYDPGGSSIEFVNGNVRIMQLASAAGMNINATLYLGWGSSSVDSEDLKLFRDGPGILGQRNGTNAQEYRPYGYFASTTGFTTGVVKSVTASVTLSGATTATSNIIPVGSFVIGVATTTTTTITGASGYQVGDGSDADRWGDITGTAVGTDSDNTNSTANPTGYFAAASAVTLTAKTSNFTGGGVQVTVFYLTTGAD